jgi:hypothetical protein
MADTKISGLPASTVPLSGTEVLPIVQGTTTKKVSIANVTAGRAVSALSLTSTNDASISGLTVGKGGGNVASNTAVGFEAINATATGAFNTALGYRSLYSNTSGNSNHAIGSEALYSTTSGAQNIAIGNGAMYGNVSGAANIGISDNALRNTTGSQNIGIGYDAGRDITSGINNVCLGVQAGFSGTNNITTGANNIIIGYNAAASSATVSNEITLGNASVTSLRIPGVSISATTTALTSPAFIPSSATVPTNGLYLPTTNTLSLATNSAEKVRVTSDGYLLVGTTYGSGVNVIGTNPFLLVNRNIQAFRDTVNSAGPRFGMLKTRAALGVFGIVADGDNFGTIDFAGDNGVNYNSVGASINAQVDGTPSSTSMPGRLIFSTTAAGGIAATERMRIYSGGGVCIGNTTDPGTGNLRVNGKVKTGGYTVATLPAGVVGDIAYVTDATAPTYLGALIGGGAITCPVFFNGTAWVSA